MSVSVSDSVRMAMAKAGIRQTKLAKLWGTTPQAIYNKLNMERWSARDLARIAEITGGRLAIIYPDGQQILVDPPAEEAAAEKPEAPVKAEKAKVPVKAEKAKPAAKPAKKAQAKPKKAKEPEVLEEQISFFN